MKTHPQYITDEASLSGIAQHILLEVTSISLLERNKSLFSTHGIDYSTLILTKTGITKSILDATQQVRQHFEASKIHSYSTQQQGKDHKVFRNTYFVTATKRIKTIVSLYRPTTKNGDPRLWFSGLAKFASAGDKIALIVHDESIFVFNISRYELPALFQKSKTVVSILLREIIGAQNSVALELLNKLKVLAQQPIKAIKKGDTAIGMSIEHALDIQPNSDKKPDYKGIELKSARGNKTRTTLFAQVADWELSTYKSSAQILDTFGYDRDDDFKLYCTLSTKKANTQGLSFNYAEKADELHEVHEIHGHVATWKGKTLRDRLLEKHSETFFIQADSEFIDDQEFFHLKSVTHTKAPLLNQLMSLLVDGTITMDHLIKRKGATNRVSEKGPLFKINKKDLKKLFPKPVEYNLL